MNINIRKIFFITLWCIVGAGVLVLLGAAINHRNNKTCKGYKIDISNVTHYPFIDKKEIAAILVGAGPGQISDRRLADDNKGEAFISTFEKTNMIANNGSAESAELRLADKWRGRHILSFDLRRMESVLEKNVWIRDAQLFFDNNEVLTLNITEREPVARIFTVDGNSFYIDSSGVQLPLSNKISAKLPVFTGYPALKLRLHAADNALIGQIRRLSVYIRKDPFWMAQITQVDITPAWTFEMVPMIGDHLIEFGDGSDYEQKFHRLFVFYKEVLSRTGFNKYSRINVQYAGQVIGTQKGSEGTRFDSMQGMKNIQQLIRSAQQLRPDTARQQNIRPLERSILTEQTLTNYDLIPDNSDSARAASFIRSPGPPHERPAAGPPAGNPDSRRPKAIMPKPVKTTKIN